MENKLIEFCNKLKEEFGYTYDSLSVISIGRLVFSKEDETIKYFINLNFIEKEITAYKVYNLTSKNFNELKEELSNEKTFIPHAYSIDFNLMKYISENLDTLEEALPFYKKGELKC